MTALWQESPPPWRLADTYLMYQYLLYPLMVPVPNLIAMFTGFRRTPMAHKFFPTMLFLRNVPAPTYTHMSTGFRLAPWPPMAHRIVLTKVVVMIPRLALKLNLCRSHPDALDMFEGFRCRPHLRV
jgi:hypothetical protein